MTIRKQIISIALLMPLSLPAARDLTVPMDPEIGKQLEEKARSAERDGNYDAALREFHRYLEIYPNDPAVRAPIYMAMSEMAKKAGDTRQAEEYAAGARSLDPTLEGRVAAAAGNGITRGQKADVFSAILSVGMQTVAVAMQQRQTYQLQQQQRMIQAQQGQLAPQPQPGYAYPQAPVGQPGYQAPANGYSPMPGYAPAPGQMDPNAQAVYPQPMPQQQQYAPQQPLAQQPQYVRQQPSQQQPYTQQQPMPPQPQYAQQPQFAQPAPYAAPASYMIPAGATRGDRAKPIRVIHDRSRLGDKAYFEKAAGALLAVEGTSLTFTSSGGESPLMIPASEIAEIKLNAVVGKAVGAFHITTKKGLYLNLAPESGDREEARADVEALKKQLGLTI